jgi:hypothetical protein
MCKFYNTNGISTKQSTVNSVVYECSNHISVKENDNTGEIDFKLISLTHNVAIQIFGNFQKLYSLQINTIPPYAGIDAEIKISKKEFEKWLSSQKTEDTNRILYYYDFQNLVGSLQNLIQESRFLYCDFYKVLNENSFMLAEKPMEPNALMFASGRLVTNIFSKINHLFINLASQLDFITKISFELENLPNDFSKYPKMKSNGILYGDLKKINFISREKTIFDKTDDLKLILSLRNEIVHNASFENIPKVYQVFKNNEIIEKYIYVPDSTNGVFDSYKNRNRFFNKETKLNEILPDLLTSFWRKMEITIDRLKK